MAPPREWPHRRRERLHAWKVPRRAEFAGTVASVGESEEHDALLHLVYLATSALEPRFCVIVLRHRPRHPRQPHWPAADAAPQGAISRCLHAERRIIEAEFLDYGVGGLALRGPHQLDAGARRESTFLKVPTTKGAARGTPYSILTLRVELVVGGGGSLLDCCFGSARGRRGRPRSGRSGDRLSDHQVEYKTKYLERALDELRTNIAHASKLTAIGDDHASRGGAARRTRDADDRLDVLHAAKDAPKHHMLACRE